MHLHHNLSSLTVKREAIYIWIQKGTHDNWTAESFSSPIMLLSRCHGSPFKTHLVSFSYEKSEIICNLCDLLDFSFRAPNNKIFQSTTSQIDKKEDFRHVGYHIYPILTFYLHLPYPCSFRFMIRSLTMKPSNIYIWTYDLFFLQLAGLFISSYKYIDHVHDHKR